MNTIIPEALKSYVIETPFGLALHHPLYVQQPYYGHHEGFDAVDVIQCKQQHVDEAWRDKQWGPYIWLHERAYRTDALMCIFKDADLPHEELGPLCASVWTDSENINQNLEEWAELFATVAGENWMRDEDKQALAAMPDQFMVWRGVCDDGGYSWTLSEKTASFFANRGIHNSSGLVVHKTVDKCDVFAYIDSRGEEEVLIT